MTIGQAVLAGAVSLVFAALVGVCVRTCVRAHVLPVALRWAAGTVLVLSVAGFWLSTLAPRTNPDGGATCIEEPLVGMLAASQLSSPGCATANQEAVVMSVVLAGVITLVGVGVVRAMSRSRTT